MALATAMMMVLVFLPGTLPRPSVAVASIAFTAQCAREPGQPSLVVAGVWRDEERTRFERVLALFERKTGARVTYAYETHDIAKTIKQRLARGCPPDVALLPQPALLEDLARRGHLRPMDRSVQSVVERNYGRGWRRLASVDGKPYGVWFKAANKSTFWFSRRAFRRADVGAPSTWPQLQRVAARLRAVGIAPFSVAGADGWTLTDWFENVYLASAGPRRYDALARHRLAWTDPSVKAALQRLAEILGRPDWLAGGTSGALRTDFVESVGQVFDRPATAGIVYEGDFVANIIAGRADAQHHDVGHFAFPAIGSHGPPMVVGGDVAAQFTSHPLAGRFMRFLATPEAAVPWARAGGFISPNRRLHRDQYGDDTTRRLADALVRARAPRFDLSDLQPPSFGATAGQGMWGILQQYLRAPETVEAVTRQLQSAATAARDCDRVAGGRC